MGSWVVPGYTEVRDLGCGQAGRVTLAWHDPTGTPVAIRYLREDLRADADVRRAVQVESHRLTELDDPHVVRCYEYVESPGGAALVMELVDGATLREILDEGGPLGAMGALTVLKDSLLGLGAAHRRGVLHRDYRPEHVLVDSEGRAKLIEFGLARWPDGRYTAPEGAPTIAADLYAATATFAECAGTVPEALRGLTAIGLAADPATRPPDAAAFLAELDDAAAVYGAGWERGGRDLIATRADRLLHVRDTPAAPAPTGGGRNWGSRLLIGVAVALVVAAAVASWVTH